MAQCPDSKIRPPLAPNVGGAIPGIQWSANSHSDKNRGDANVYGKDHP